MTLVEQALYIAFRGGVLASGATLAVTFPFVVWWLINIDLRKEPLEQLKLSQHILNYQRVAWARYMLPKLFRILVCSIVFTTVIAAIALIFYDGAPLE